MAVEIGLKDTIILNISSQELRQMENDKLRGESDISGINERSNNF